MLTLDDAQELVIKNSAKGVECPCCRQFCKIYKRSIHKKAAISLHWMAKRQRWIHIPTEAPPWLIKDRSYNRLAYWGLVETKENSDPSKNASGYWRTTEKGTEFATGTLFIPKFVFIYIDIVLKFSPELISFAMIRKRFNLQDDMIFNS